MALSGVVTFEDEPVANATVYIIDAESGEIVTTTTTNNSGEYSVSDTLVPSNNLYVALDDTSWNDGLWNISSWDTTERRRNIHVTSEYDDGDVFTTFSEPFVSDWYNLSFDGSSYIDTGFSPDISDGGTVSMWVNTDDGDFAFGSHSRSDGGDNRLYLHSGWTWGIGDNYGNGQSFPEKETLVVMQWDGEGSVTLRFGPDNIVVDEEDAYSISGDNRAPPLYFGAYNDEGDDDKINGTVDDVRLYNRVLSEEEIEYIAEERYTTVVDDGLIGWWPSNEGNGWWPLNRGNGITDDNIVGGNDGTLVNGPEWVDSIIPRDKFRQTSHALEFDGEDDYVQSPSDGLQSDVFTLSVWFRADSSTHPNDWGGVVSSGSMGSGNVRMLLDGSSEGTVYVSVDDSQSSESIGWAFDSLHHWLYAYDGSDLLVYLDGDLNVTRIDADIDSIDFGESGGPFFGAQSDGTREFGGIIDDPRIYDRALTESEIQALYEGQHISDGLVGWWPMYEGRGNIVFDESDRASINGTEWQKR